MALKFFAVLGCTLTISGVTPGSAQITSSPSQKVKAENKGVYKGVVSVLLTGCSSGTYQQNAPATGTFTLTSQKNLVENTPPLRVNDKAQGISVSMLNSVSPYDSKSFVASVEVTDAGQTKIRGE